MPMKCAYCDLPFDCGDCGKPYVDCRCPVYASQHRACHKETKRQTKRGGEARRRGNDQRMRETCEAMAFTVATLKQLRNDHFGACRALI